MVVRTDGKYDPMGVRSSFDNAREGRGRSKGGPESLEAVSKRWQHRRWMAWTTFIFDHLIILYIIFYTPAIAAYESIINTFFMLSGAVLGAYIGFSTWDDVEDKKKETELQKIDNSKAFETQDPSEVDET